MSASKSNLETEIKLPLPSAAAGRALLRRAGFAVDRRRVFEVNTIFDTPDGLLRRRQNLLRLRSAGRVHTLTFKNAPVPSPYKSREEIESGFCDTKAMPRILERLGYQPVFRYEKYRTEYRKPGEAGLALLDETPIGAFLELEGPSRWIARTARDLGYTPADHITASYGALHLKHAARHRIPPGDMVFTARK